MNPKGNPMNQSYTDATQAGCQPREPALREDLNCILNRVSDIETNLACACASLFGYKQDAKPFREPNHAGEDLKNIFQCLDSAQDMAREIRARIG